ncbi:class I SAM-dependent methyltransferase [Paracidovorax avenae]|uniref:class I SAM-dependent methyltransferase n=1 Tax=Paracidovorax avenae TaxID=80867 RepID=UPI000D20428E|nr:class I SAM-dependent methyltransferase [Paracidovorax avenae]AVT02853.1 class I SAM-dependent methyltransferase [Paracidovorax avenae]
MQPVDIDELYGAFADAYARFSKDRDFTAQIRRIVEMHGRRAGSLHALELFAGPAEHSRAFVAEGFGAATAIDSAPAMAELAAGAAPLRYLISRLPALPEEVGAGSMDIVIAPRYSLGYLSNDESATLLHACANVLRRDGLFVAELHDPRKFLNHLDDLDIKTRRFHTASGARGSVEWPFGPVRLRQEGWIAEMDVRLEVDDHPEPRIFTSVEHLHTQESLRFACRGVPHVAFAEAPLSVEEFPGSLLAIFRKIA